MITNHVTSLEVSKRLAPHLPVGWESIMRWQRSRRNKYNKWGAWKADMPMFYDVQDELYQFYPAPLLSEMLDMLPTVIFGKSGGAYHWEHTIGCIKYVKISGKGEKILTSFYYFASGRLKEAAATAAAELFLWVKENGHIKEGA